MDPLQNVRDLVGMDWRPKVGYRPSRLMRAVLRLGQSLQVGTLVIILPDGSMRRFTGREAGPEATLIIHNDRIARRFLVGGSLGFCEGYLDGDWSSPDLAALFEVTLRNEQAFDRLLDGRRWYRLIQSLMRGLQVNSRRGSRRNIAYHYDLGNRFYEQWLDRSMTYSSALFDGSAGEDLTSAQTRKYAELARRMDLQAGHRVLEIGCGWGGFAEYAAGTVGAHVTAITISREQHDYATRRIAEAGLGDRVEVRLQDYRDVEGRFDRIASVEMFEAVGERYWPTFFRTVRDRLTEDGVAALQIITIADRYFETYRRGADYIQKYVFPGGMLPSPTELRRQTAEAGLAWRGDFRFGEHYARTLKEWRVRFLARWPEIAAMGFDNRFKRLWEQYLQYCEAGFTVGTIDVVQVALSRK